MKHKPFERLSGLLARFKQLSYSTQVFATERDVKKYGHTRPEELRGMLLHELQFLKSQHVLFEKVWGKTFKELEYVLRHAKDIDLREHLYKAHEDLAIIRRSLFRSELAGWSDRELIDEWHEWESMKCFDGSELRDAIREERQELLRSELTTRGLGKKIRKEVIDFKSEEKFADQKSGLNESPSMNFMIEESQEIDANEFFQDWDMEFRQLVENEADYLQQALDEIQGCKAFGNHSLPLLKKHNRAQAEKRRLHGALGI